MGEQSMGELAMAMPRETLVSVECAAPWGAYRYRATRCTTGLREAMGRVEERLENEVLDECRRYGSAVQNKDGNPYVEMFNELAMGAHERARDERIRASCRESGWTGEQERLGAATY